jgi:hypothetical protein
MKKKMKMLIGVDSYFRVEIDELVQHKMDNQLGYVYVSQSQGWAWDKAAWDHYAKKADRLSFLNANRVVVCNDNYWRCFVFSNVVLE